MLQAETYVDLGAGAQVSTLRLLFEILAVHEVFGGLVSAHEATLINEGSWWSAGGQVSYHRDSVENHFGVSRSVLSLLARVRLLCYSFDSWTPLLTFLLATGQHAHPSSFSGLGSRHRAPVGRGGLPSHGGLDLACLPEGCNRPRRVHPQRARRRSDPKRCACAPARTRARAGRRRRRRAGQGQGRVGRLPRHGQDPPAQARVQGLEDGRTSSVCRSERPGGLLFGHQRHPPNSVSLSSSTFF